MTTKQIRRERSRHRKSLGPQFSEAARLLWVRAIDEHGVAAGIGCDPWTAYRWLFGDRRPSARWLAAIQARFGIPAGEWFRPPAGDLPSFVDAA